MVKKKTTKKTKTVIRYRIEVYYDCMYHSHETMDKLVGRKSIGHGTNLKTMIGDSNYVFSDVATAVKAFARLSKPIDVTGITLYKEPI